MDTPPFPPLALPPLALALPSKAKAVPPLPPLPPFALAVES